MRVLLRHLLLAATACAACLAAGWVAAQGDVGRPAREWVDAVARRERLEAEQVAVTRRIEAKRQVAGEVAAGRLSLAGAAARFRAVDEECPFPRALARRLFYPAMSEEEWLCREVSAYVGEALRGQPGRAARVLSRRERAPRDPRPARDHARLGVLTTRAEEQGAAGEIMPPSRASAV